MPGVELEERLESAVSLAINPGSVDLIGIGCRAVCQLYNRPGCLCGNGQWATCHAKELYRDHVTAVVLAFKQAGALPKR